MNGVNMKKTIVLTTLALATMTAFGQTADSGSSSNSTSGSTSGALAVGGGLSNATLNSTIGGNRNANANRNTNTNTARGGNGGNAANTSNVTVNLGSAAGDPSGTGANAQPVANAQDPLGSAGNPQTIHENIKSVGNPGAMSFGVSFSQYNCANTAGAGVGFMGGVVQLGGGLESAPCNARANASAFFQIAQTLAQSNPQLSAQLFHAAILLIGNSTKDTQSALAAAGVSDWAAVTGPATYPKADPTPIVPPPADVGKIGPAISQPQVVSTPLESLPQAQPLRVEPMPAQPDKTANEPAPQVLIKSTPEADAITAHAAAIAAAQK